MTPAIVRVVALSLFASSARSAANRTRSRYEPTWASLDSRPLPTWYDDAKIGVFIHMGVFSVPSFHGEWFWADLVTARDADVVAFVAETERPTFQYPEYASRLTYEFFNASEWLELFAASGAKYVVPTTKHHEGFTMWPSPTAFNWNSLDVGPHRDVYGELVNATRAVGLHVGAYHSLLEWYNPLLMADAATNFTSRSFPSTKTMPELYDLVHRYEPELIWSDGDWVGPGDSYWQGTEFLAWLANDSPVSATAVWNDRWGGDALCHHGSFYTCADRFLPNKLVGHKWENAFTIDTQSWGYRRNAVLGDYMTTAQVVATVVQTTALGGNSLINVGPARDGTIDVIFADRLRGLGAWLATNGAAIYATTPWATAQNDTAASAWYTVPKAGPPGTLFATLLAWPPSGRLVLVAPQGVEGSTRVTLLGGDGRALLWAPLHAPGAPGVVISLPSPPPGSPLAAAPAWCVRFDGAAGV